MTTRARGDNATQMLPSESNVLNDVCVKIQTPPDGHPIGNGSLDCVPGLDGGPLRRRPAAHISRVLSNSAGSHSIVAAARRCFDVVVGSLILILVAPVMLLIALCVVLESPGPVLYRGRRVGRWGTPVAILKFRKMREDAAGRPLTLAHDDRFTRIGRWLARTKLDELPQLLNVVRGEMSLVGPRPEDPLFIERYADAFEPILRVRPGITGLSQLAFRAESRILDPNDPIGDYEKRILPHKLRLDALYVTRSNPLLDIRILLWTLVATIGVPVSVNRSTARMTLRLSRGGRRQTTHAPAVAREAVKVTVSGKSAELSIEEE